MSPALAVLAQAGGSFIILGALVVGFFTVVFSYYTIRGSGINKHPNDGLDGAPGSQGPSEASGMGRNSGSTRADHSVGDTFSTRGTG
jgi:hypothetical protein